MTCLSLSLARSLARSLIWKKSNSGVEGDIRTIVLAGLQLLLLLLLLGVAWLLDIAGFYQLSPQQQPLINVISIGHSFTTISVHMDIVV